MARVLNQNHLCKQAYVKQGRWHVTAVGYLHDLFLMHSMQTLSMFLCRVSLTNNKSENENLVMAKMDP